MQWQPECAKVCVPGTIRYVDLDRTAVKEKMEVA